ncbi:GOLPH3/VPS74 family protein [Streptomyces graminilatus]|uniref:GOLPH3/VPS74 family protein n=1 Tax=Streptomyces graminilatus TaxID=1464070 RepID=UPI0006E141F5|nr:GPP34 family phosphoprotein [Streptomyces graminilatus]
MTTAQDLMLIALELPAEQPVERGHLSLALAGAEAIDLLAKEALSLDGDRILPGLLMATGDPLLDQAAASLTRQEPYETVDAWLWRRGGGLSAAYAHALERAGLVTHPRHFGLRSTRIVLADSPARRDAEERRDSGERVLTALLAAVGTGEEPPEPHEDPVGEAVDEAVDEAVTTVLDAVGDAVDEAVDEAVTTVLDAVGDAVTELEAVRLRRDVENAAFDNIWRG